MAVQTQIQTRRGTAATWTSTNPTLAAGEIGFESDTNKFKIGTGSTAWTALAYAANTSPLTTKGDLYTYSTDNTRLAVGNNGETLVADSSTSTGLRYGANYAAGKNKIINGDFAISQRGTTFTNPTVNQYTLDRWYFGGGGNLTGTISQQTFTPGTAPVAGYEGSNFFRITGSCTLPAITQRIEDVRTFAGQTVTVSFWAKANANVTISNVNLAQVFGSGGSATVDNPNYNINITTSWVRYTSTFNVPSIAGKTIGTGSYLNLSIQLNTMSSQTIDFWGMQVEAGSVATAFQTATGTIQGELSAAQRYYWRSTPGTAYAAFAMGGCQNANNGQFYVTPPVPMRTVPTTIDYSGIMIIDAQYNGGGTPSLAIGESANFPVRVYFLSATGLTGNAVAFLRAGNNTTAYFGLGAEL